MTPKINFFHSIQVFYFIEDRKLLENKKGTNPWKAKPFFSKKQAAKRLKGILCGEEEENKTYIQDVEFAAEWEARLRCGYEVCWYDLRPESLSCK